MYYSNDTRYYDSFRTFRSDCVGCAQKESTVLFARRLIGALGLIIWRFWHHTVISIRWLDDDFLREATEVEDVSSAFSQALRLLSDQ